MGVLKGPSFITLKAPIFYYIDQDYLTLFFCVESDFVIYVNRCGTCNTYLRYFRLQIFDQCTNFYLHV